MSGPNPPIAEHIGLHYVLKMTNLARPDGMGTPNFLYLIGPFPDRIAASAWGSNPENNKADSPLWQVVALGDFPGHLPLYAPDIAAEVDHGYRAAPAVTNATIAGSRANFDFTKAASVAPAFRLSDDPRCNS